MKIMNTKLKRGSLLTTLLTAMLLVVAGNVFAQFDPAIYYRITAKHSGKCLAVAGGMNSLRNGDRVIQWECIEAEDNQKWQVVAVGDGYYKIIAKHSGKGLDVFGGTVSTGNGVAVQQWDYVGGDNQKWKIESVGDGYYSIMAKHSGKSLDVNGGVSATSNGPQAQQWDYVGNDNQKWRLTPVSGGGTAGIDSVTGTFTYSDSEVDSDGTGAFRRPIVGCLVQVWRAGGLAARTETDSAGTFSVQVPRMSDGTDTTVLLYATNSAAQVLAGVGPYFIRRTQLSRGGTPLNFSENLSTVQDRRSFNAAHNLRLAYDYARARRDSSESEVIPKVDVSFVDDESVGTRYNQPASSLLIHHVHNEADLVIMHEYAHFLEDKISSFLLLPSYHDTCSMSQRCRNPADCLNLPGTTATQLINTPENAWMEGFANYFAMAVKRANPSERLNQTSWGTMPERELNAPEFCAAVGRTAFDGHLIDGSMIERFVSGALWNLTNGQPADTERAVFQIFDRELDSSAKGVLPNIKLFHDAWVARGLNHARLDAILTTNIPTVASHSP